MTLRLRSALAITTVFFFLAGCLLIVFNTSIMGGYEALETQGMNRNVDRVLEAIQDIQDELQMKAVEWGHWDDTYKFIQNLNEDYKESNLSYDALTQLGLRHFVLKDMKAKYPISLHVADEEVEKFDPQSEPIVAEYLSGADAAELMEGASGLVRLKDQLFIYGASAISDSAATAPVRGVIFFTREFNDEVNSRITDVTKLNVDLSPVWKVEGDSVSNVLKTLIGGQASVLERDNDSIVGYGLVRDALGAPTLLVKVSQKREIIIQGRSTRNLVVFYLLASTIVATLMALLFLSRRVIGPIAALGEQAQRIGNNRDYSLRVSTTADAELKQVADQINGMFEALEIFTKEITLARDAAESANAAKSSFIAKVSHELRTPINCIMGMQRIILKESKSSGIKHYVRLAQESAKGLLETINEILDFSKVESGNLTIEKIPFDIREVVRETMRLLSGRLEGKSELEVVCDVMPDVPPELEGDPTRLRQVLVNLIGNSIKFTPQGHVAVTVRNISSTADWQGIEIAVSDTGIGIPQEKLGSIFEPFKQADDTVTRNYQGTGLGLTIVKQLAEAMNGEVGVESVVGEGTTFFVRLRIPFVGDPIYSIPQNVAPPHVAVIDGASRGASLMVESFERLGLTVTRINSRNDEHLTSIEGMIEPTGLIVATSEALERSRVFDLVLSKVTEGTTPVVAVLRPSDISLRERLFALGVKYILTRPLLAEDVFFALSGDIPMDVQSWEDNEESSLNLSRKLRILVADDAPTNRMILENMLGDAGHEVVCVDDGLSMVKRIQGFMDGTSTEEPFDIVLTDIQMPLMDGMTATRTIRDLESAAGGKRHVPVVAVTAHAMVDEHTRMHDAGMDGIVTKPIEPGALAEILKRLTNTESVESSSIKTEPKGGVNDLETLQNVAERIWTQLRVEQSEEFKILSTGAKTPELTLERFLDIPDIYQRTGDSVRRSGLIFKAFSGSFKERLAHLGKAKNTGDLDQLRKSAHALKGLLLDIGSKVPGALAGTIETLAVEERLESACALVSGLTAQVLIVARLVELIVDEMEQGGGMQRKVPSGAQQSAQV